MIDANEERKKPEESENNNNDSDDSGEFKNVPIEHSIEIVNIINNMNKISRDKFKKKFFKQALVVVAIIAFLILTKKYLYDGIIKLFFEDKIDSENYYSLFDNKTQNNTYTLKNEESRNGEIFYLFQNETTIKLESFSSKQLRNPKKINIVEKLEITLSIEYEKFVHLKIKDADEKRWEVPEKDVLNEEYLKKRIDNKNSLSTYSHTLVAENFCLEFLQQKKDVDMMRFYDEGQRMVDFNENMEKNYNDNGIDNENSNNNEFAFRLMNDDKKEFFYFNASESFLFSDKLIIFQYKLTSDKIYGFGERTHDFKLGEGTFTMWPFDCSGTIYDDGLGGMNQYSHQPIALHKTRYKNLWLGLVFLNTNAQDVVIQSSEDDDTEMFLTHKAIGGIIDYYIIVGNSPENVVKNIQFLLGIPPLPPYWSLGNHQSRYGLKTFEEFKNIYNNYKKLEIPIDAMWIDIEAMNNYEVFTLNKKFANLSSFIDETIHKDGGKFVPIIDMGISLNSKYAKLGNSLDIFIKSNYTKENLIGKVWPGKTVFPDFFNPKINKFWKKGLDDYHKLVNYDGIWLDMNEPANMVKNSSCLGEVLDNDLCVKTKNKYHKDELPYIPGYRNKINDNLSFWSISENALIYGNNTVYDIKPLLSFYQNKITYIFLENNLEIRPFILSRSTTLGTGKYAFHWLGDNYSSYSNIKNSISGIFNFNIFGIPFSGADICGFMLNAENELCLRWYNLGTFYPFMRNHNFKNSKDQYPWSFNDTNKQYDTISIIKKNINIRYSLLRYIYSQLFLISLNEKGSFFKPVMFEFPQEKKSYKNIESRVMFGEAFLICTFYEKSEDNKEFEFPNSNFNKYPKGKTIMNYDDENRIISLSGKLDELHIFLRGGFIIPYQNTFDKYILNSLKLREEKLNLIVNIDHTKKSKGVLFFDNDGINTIKKGEYIRVNLDYNENVLHFYTNKNKLKKYKFNDHILGSLEFLRINEIMEINEIDKNRKFTINIVYNKDMNKKKEIRNGMFDNHLNKVTFEVSNEKEFISIFDIQEITIN